MLVAGKLNCLHCYSSRRARPVAVQRLDSRPSAILQIDHADGWFDRRFSRRVLLVLSHVRSGGSEESTVVVIVIVAAIQWRTE